MNNHPEGHDRSRSLDRWLLYWRPLELIVVFLFGLASGVVTTALLYRDHEKRLLNLEKWTKEHAICDLEMHRQLDERIKVTEGRLQRVLAVLEDRFRVRIP